MLGGFRGLRGLTQGAEGLGRVFTALRSSYHILWVGAGFLAEVPAHPPKMKALTGLG